MSNKKRLQNIWAMTDQSAIEAMTTKTCSPLPGSSSSDEDNDSEASNSTYGSFVAVPKEFRPNLPSANLDRTKCLTPSVSVPKSLVQTSNSQFKNSSSNELQRASLSKSPVSYDSQPITNTLGQNKQTDLPKKDLFKNRALAYEISSQNIEKTADIKCANSNSRKISSQDQRKADTGGTLHKKQHCATESQRSKPRTKSELKYECVEKQVHGATLHLNFEVPSCKDKESHSNDKIQYKMKVSQNERKNNNTAIRKTDPRGFRSRSRNRKRYVPHQTSFEENVRWDNTLNFSEHNESTLNSDSDNNIEKKIEWTVVKEQNITASSTRKIKFEKNVPNKLTAEYESRLADPNQVKKHTKRYHSRNSSSNARCSQTNLNRNKLQSVPKCNLSQKEAFSSNNRNLDLDSKNVKCMKDKILNSDIRSASGCVNDDVFTQQCRIRDPISTHQNIPNINSLSSCSRSNDAIVPNIAQLNMPVDSSDKIDNDFIQREQTVTLGVKKSSTADSRAIEAKRNTILEYGREMLDLIIGSHTALSLFFATYESWKTSRQQLIHHFETLERNLKETSKKYTRYKEIINMARTCASTAELIPIPHVSLAAKVVTIVTGLFSKVFKTDSAKAEVEDSNDITTAVFRDAHASGDLYMYGLQCHQQFEETTKYIEKFHSKARHLQYFDVENGEMTDFVEGMLEYKPNHRTFYAKLYMCFQQLQQASFHNLSKRFCEPLSINSNAVEVVKFLTWRFRYEEFSPQSVQFEMEQLHRVIQDSNVSIKDLLARVQGLLRLLHSELGFIETCVKDVTLFNDSFCQSSMEKIVF